MEAGQVLLLDIKGSLKEGLGIGKSVGHDRRQ